MQRRFFRPSTPRVRTGGRAASTCITTAEPRSRAAPVAVANLPVGHGGTYFEPNGGAAASVAVSWLDWQLRDDAESAKRFVGEHCGLCEDEKWTLQRKQFPGASDH